MIDETNNMTREEYRAQRKAMAKEFRASLQRCDTMLRELIDTKQVMAGTALYGFLQSAKTCLCMAYGHCNELDAVLTDLNSGDWICGYQD